MVYLVYIPETVYFCGPLSPSLTHVYQHYILLATYKNMPSLLVVKLDSWNLVGGTSKWA